MVFTMVISHVFSIYSTTMQLRNKVLLSFDRSRGLNIGQWNMWGETSHKNFHGEKDCRVSNPTCRARVSFFTETRIWRGSIFLHICLYWSYCVNKYSCNWRNTKKSWHSLSLYCTFTTKPLRSNYRIWRTKGKGSRLPVIIGHENQERGVMFSHSIVEPKEIP